MSELYDKIGGDYGVYRRPDPRIAAAIHEALGAAESIVNVGAGAGSYEPSDRYVVAVEPSRAMIRQRRLHRAPVIQASATDLPLRAGAAAAAMAVLTVHHWPERRRGLSEMRRVARERVVILTWDPASHGFWLVEEYFPELVEIDLRIFPSLDELRAEFRSVEISPLLIPHDCSDGFLGAYWRRPRAYLDAGVRGAISTFSKIDPDAGLMRLRDDLKNGTWRSRHRRLLDLDALDLGYRLVVGRC